MKKILLLTLFVWVNGLYAFDNVAELETFERIITQDDKSLQKAKNLCMRDKLWIDAYGSGEHFANACYAVAAENLIQNSFKGSDDVELKEDLELMKKACAITLIKIDGCWAFIVSPNVLLKDRLNLLDDYYVSESLKKQSFEYLSKACDKEYSIFQTKAKNKNSINGFYKGTTCLYLSVMYVVGIGTLKDNEKASFYKKRADEIERGAK